MPRAIHNGSELPELWGAYGRTSVPPSRMLRAGAISLAFHILMFAVFLAMPDTEYRFIPYTALRPDLKKAVKLVAPRSLELTQKDSNKGQVRQELDIRSALPQTPAPRPFRPPAPAAPAELPAPVLGPAPQIDAVFEAPQIAAAAPGLANVPRPVERPKLVLENVSPTPPAKPPENPLIRAPRISAEEAARAAAAGGSAGLDSEGQADDPASVGNMQLMSDPQGVDFKPYMLQVLATVRRNWFNIIPPIARTGRPGLVQVQFIINKKGEVPKLVIASGSGTPAFDRAAVASISASYPFPPLPAEYPGAEIRLQLAFSYNLARAR